MTCTNCEVLREIVRRLERELGLRRTDGQIGALMHRLNLEPAHARILSVLYAAQGRFMTRDNLMNAAGIATYASLKTQICRIRSVIGYDMIASTQGQGWALSGPGMSMVLAAIQPPELQDERG